MKDGLFFIIRNDRYFSYFCALKFRNNKKRTI